MLRAEMKQTLLFTSEQVPVWGSFIASICIRFPQAVVTQLSALRDVLDQPVPDLDQAGAIIKWLEYRAKAHVEIGDQVAQKVGQSEPELIEGERLQ